jgi:hypothetical protein
MAASAVAVVVAVAARTYEGPGAAVDSVAVAVAGA